MSFVARLIAISFSAALLSAQTPCISFAPSLRQSGLGPLQSGMATQDFNSDNRPDLAYLTPNGFAITLSGRTARTGFLQPLSFPAGPALTIQLSDIDSDGKPDVVLLKSASVEVWRNSSVTTTPSFNLAFSSSLSSPSAMAIADMNTDTKGEIAVLSPSSVTVLRNTSTVGNISFVLETPITQGGIGFFVRDRNNDGAAEVHVVASTANLLTRFFSNTSTPGGAIQLSNVGSVFIGNIPTTPPYSGFVTAHLVRDLVEDAVFGFGSTLWILAGSSLPGATNLIASEASSINFGSNILDYEIADFNADGLNDIIAATESGLKLVINNTPSGAALFSGSIVDLGNPGARDLLVGDFSGDSRPDILVSGFSAAQAITVYFNGAVPVVLTANPNPAIAGSPVELSAAVLFPSCAVPEGSIQFARGSTTLGTAPLSAGMARLFTTFSAGIQTLSATFLPANSNSPIRSGSGSATVFVDSGACAAQIPQASIQAGALRLDRVTNQFVQTITIRNDSPNHLTGPLSLATANLPPGVNLVGSTAATGCAVPSGTPFVNLDLCTGGQLAPGASLSTTLRFSNPLRIPLQYTPIVLAGFAQR